MERLERSLVISTPRRNLVSQVPQLEVLLQLPHNSIHGGIGCAGHGDIVDVDRDSDPDILARVYTSQSPPSPVLAPVVTKFVSTYKYWCQ